MARSTDEDLASYRDDYDASAVGVAKDLVVIPGPDRHVWRTYEELLPRIHSHGMKAVAYAFRNEPQFLAWDYGQVGGARELPDGTFLNKIKKNLRAQQIVTFCTCGGGWGSMSHYMF